MMVMMIVVIIMMMMMMILLIMMMKMRMNMMMMMMMMLMMIMITDRDNGKPDEDLKKLEANIVYHGGSNIATSLQGKTFSMPKSIFCILASTFAMK